MTAIPEYDPEAAMQETGKRLHQEWEELRGCLTSGQKAWLTQTRNFCERLMHADPEAAIILLARYEFLASMRHKQKTSRNEAEEETYLSDFIEYKPISPD
jgi:hypothetical protein